MFYLCDGEWCGCYDPTYETARIQSQLRSHQAGERHPPLGNVRSLDLPPVQKWSKLTAGARTPNCTGGNGLFSDTRINEIINRSNSSLSRCYLYHCPLIDRLLYLLFFSLNQHKLAVILISKIKHRNHVCAWKSPHCRLPVTSRYGTHRVTDNGGRLIITRLPCR